MTKCFFGLLNILPLVCFFVSCSSEGGYVSSSDNVMQSPSISNTLASNLKVDLINAGVDQANAELITAEALALSSAVGKELSQHLVFGQFIAGASSSYQQVATKFVEGAMLGVAKTSLTLSLKQLAAGVNTYASIRSIKELGADLDDTNRQAVVEAISNTAVIKVEGTGLSGDQLSLAISSISEKGVSAISEAGVPTTDVSKLIEKVSTGATKGLASLSVTTALAQTLSVSVSAGSIKGLASFSAIQDLDTAILISNVSAGLTEGLVFVQAELVDFDLYVALGATETSIKTEAGVLGLPENAISSAIDSGKGAITLPAPKPSARDNLDDSLLALTTAFLIGETKTIKLVASDAQNSNAIICYTLDNSDPFCDGSCTAGLTYTTPFTLTETITLKALSCSSGKSNSPLVTYSLQFTENAPPSLVTNFSGVASNSSEISLSWTAATDYKSSAAEISYEICYSAHLNGCNTFTPNVVTSAGETSVTLTGLTAEVNYYILIRAKDGDGVTGAPVAVNGNYVSTATSQTINQSVSITGGGVLGGAGIVTRTNYNADVTISGCTSSSPVTLSGRVFIGSGATLTVNSGCTVKANSDVLSALIISQGGQIHAVGTSTSPIIWTSDKVAGSRAAGDWGGIEILGRAPVNITPGERAATDTDRGTGSFGGVETADNSGSLRYNQINFAGKSIGPDQDFNGLFLAGVGSGTTISTIQVANTADDGIEIQGGNVNLDYLVLFNNSDDAFDVDSGWIGSATHLAIDITDIGDNCIEYDGLGADADRPSNSVISNVTCVSDSDNTKKSILNIDEAGCVTLVNSLFEGFSSQYLAVAASSVSKYNATLSSALTFNYGTCDLSANSVVFADITGKDGNAVGIGNTTTDFTCGNGNNIDDGSDCDASTSAHWVALSTLFPGGTTNASVVSGVLTGANDATTRAEFVPSSNPGTAAGATVAHPASGSNVTIGNYNGAVDQANASAWLLDSWTDFAYN